MLARDDLTQNQRNILIVAREEKMQLTTLIKTIGIVIDLLLQERNEALRKVREVYDFGNLNDYLTNLLTN